VSQCRIKVGLVDVAPQYGGHWAASAASPVSAIACSSTGSSLAASRSSRSLSWGRCFANRRISSVTSWGGSWLMAASISLMLMALLYEVPSPGFHRREPFILRLEGQNQRARENYHRADCLVEP